MKKSRKIRKLISMLLVVVCMCTMFSAVPVSAASETLLWGSGRLIGSTFTIGVAKGTKYEPPANYTWKSSNTSIATLSNTASTKAGTVTVNMKKVGTFTITATNKTTKKSYSHSFTATSRLKAITLEPTLSVVKVGDTLKIPYSWTSTSGPKYYTNYYISAKVTGDATLVGVKNGYIVIKGARKGKAFVKLTSTDGQNISSKTISITVK